MYPIWWILAVQLFQPMFRHQFRIQHTNTVNSLLIKRYALLQSANFLFMLFAVPKFSETFLQLGDVDYDCTNRNGIGNLSHTTLFPKIFKVVLLIRIKISKNRGSSDNPDNKGPKIIRIANFFF